MALDAGRRLWSEPSMTDKWAHGALKEREGEEGAGREREHRRRDQRGDTLPRDERTQVSRACVYDVRVHAATINSR